MERTRETLDRIGSCRLHRCRRVRSGQRRGHFRRWRYFSLSSLREVGGRVQKAHRQRSELSVDRIRRRYQADQGKDGDIRRQRRAASRQGRSEEHTSELQSLRHLVCRLLLEKKKNKQNIADRIQHKRRRDFGIHIAVRETKQKKVKLVHQHSTRTTLSADIKDIMYKTHTNTR